MEIYFYDVLKNYKEVNIFLHPRLTYIKFLNIFKIKNNIKFLIYEHEKKYHFSHIISYSPTINSSIPISVKRNIKFISEIGKNFVSTKIKNKIRNFELKK